MKKKPQSRVYYNNNNNIIIIIQYYFYCYRYPCNILVYGTYQNTWLRNLEEHNPNLHRREILPTHINVFVGSEAFTNVWYGLSRCVLW